MRPKCRKPLKKPAIPKDALRVGPFVLEKGRGQRWALKGVKGVTFEVRKPPGVSDYFADLDFLNGPPSMVVNGATPEGAAGLALKLVKKKIQEVVKIDREYVRESERMLADSERIREILRTGKPPKVVHDRKMPVRRKR